VRPVGCNTTSGIKKFNWWSEALHGLANNEKVTVFPEPVGMAASFDDDIVYRVFSAVLTKSGPGTMRQSKAGRKTDGF